MKHIPPYERRLAQPEDRERPDDHNQAAALSEVGLWPTQQDLDFDAESSLQVVAEQNAMGDYADHLMEMANVPPGMIPGQTLQWSNAAKTSPTFTCAVIEIDSRKQWFEFRLAFATGRKITMRSGLDGEVMGLTDSAGMDGGMPLSILCATVVLTFAQATNELMITH